MIRHQRALKIDATPTDVWAVLGRFMHIDEFAPRVTSVEALTTGQDGVGSRRRCIFEDGSSVVEEVIEWQHNKRYRVCLQELTSMPLHEAYATISVEPVNGGQSWVNWSMDYRVKFGPFGWLLGQTLMKLMLGKIFDDNLKGLAKATVKKAIYKAQKRPM